MHRYRLTAQAVLVAATLAFGPGACSSNSGDEGGSSGGIMVHHSIDARYPNGHISSQYAGDLDGDGLPDVVIRSGKSGPAEIAWFHNPLGTPGASKDGWKKYTISNDAYPDGSKSSGTGLLLYDIDGDGRLDVITGAKVEGIGNGLFWWKCPADPVHGTWARFLIAPPDTEEYAPHDIVAADIDHDGVEDLVFGGSSNQGVYWARIPADPTDPKAWKLRKVGGPRGYAFAGTDVGDIDGDGRLDIVRSDAWYRSTGPVDNPVWEENLYGLVNVPPSNIKVFDVDGDGHMDIVVSSGHNARRGEVYWYRAGADPRQPWTAHRIGGYFDAPENLVVFNGPNGRVEVITAELDFENWKTEREAVWFTSSTHGQTWKSVVFYKGKNFHQMHAADLDNDGDLDLYAGSFTERHGPAHVDWFENVAGYGATAAGSGH